MATRETFGARLERLRTIADMSSKELDRLAGLVAGHSRSLEVGDPEGVTAKKVRQLARVFGVSIDWLFDGAGERPKPEDILAAVSRSRATYLRKAG